MMTYSLWHDPDTVLQAIAEVQVPNMSLYKSLYALIDAHTLAAKNT